MDTFEILEFPMKFLTSVTQVKLHINLTTHTRENGENTWGKSLKHISIVCWLKFISYPVIISINSEKKKYCNIGCVGIVQNIPNRQNRLCPIHLHQFLQWFRQARCPLILRPTHGGFLSRPTLGCNRCLKSFTKFKCLNSKLLKFP